MFIQSKSRKTSVRQNLVSTEERASISWIVTNADAPKSSREAHAGVSKFKFAFDFSSASYM